MKVATNQERLNELFDADPRNDSAIAAELGVSKQTISAWRSGFRSPKKPMLLKICDVFHVSIAWLMGYEVGRQETVEKSKHIVIQNMDQFSHLMQYMTPEEYETVVTAFDMAYQRMKEKGIEP